MAGTTLRNDSRQTYTNPNPFDFFVFVRRLELNHLTFLRQPNSHAEPFTWTYTSMLRNAHRTALHDARSAQMLISLHPTNVCFWFFLLPSQCKWTEEKITLHIFFSLLNNMFVPIHWLHLARWFHNKIVFISSMYYGSAEKKDERRNYNEFRRNMNFDCVIVV